MNIYDAYETDQELADAGIWCELYAPGGGKVGRVKVRPADIDLNADYRRALTKLSQRVETILRDTKGEDVNAAEDLKLMSEVYATSIVTDWEIEGPEGPIAFSTDEAQRMMLRMPKFYKAVRQAASKWTNYRKKFEADAVKT